MQELLDRARQLVAAGPYDARPAEVAAVHAAIYPDRDAVCQTCRGELGKAYYAIQRWAAQQDAAGATPFISSSTMKKNTVARLKEGIVHTPHGLGVAYSNDNLTDKAARDILKNDPEAAVFFDVLPPAAEAGEDEQDLTPAQASAEKQAEKAQHPASPAPEGIDYAKLAAAMFDEGERRQKEADAAHEKAWLDAAQQPAPAPASMPVPAPEAVAPVLTASAGGAELEVKTEELSNGVEVTTGQPADHADEQPVRLSRMNKEQLVAAYRTELNLEPAEGLTNDQLRDAIAEHRAAQA